jgi:plasmid stabilization system protein ParE
MMWLHWSDEALADLDRLFDFLAVNNPAAAERAVRFLLSAPNVLLANPAMGPRIDKLEAEQVRRLVVGSYEVRYRTTGQMVEIVRVFHTREDR